VKINKASLVDIKFCLQYAQENIEFLQLESQLQRDDLQQCSHHLQLVFGLNNPMFEFETDSHQLSGSDEISEVEVDSHSVPTSGTNLHECSCSACTSQSHHQALGRDYQQQKQDQCWI